MLIFVAFNKNLGFLINLELNYHNKNVEIQM